MKKKAFAEIYFQYGDDVQTRVVEHHLKNGGMSRYEKFRFYHENFLNIELTENELNNLANIFSDLVVEKIIASPFVEGIQEFINTYNDKYKMFISTGTPEVEIRHIMKRKGIEDFYSEIYGSPSSKIEHVQSIMNEYHFNSDEIVFVGDSIADMHVAKEFNTHFIGRITTDDSIRSAKYLIKNHCELNSIIEKLGIIADEGRRNTPKRDLS